MINKLNSLTILILQSIYVPVSIINLSVGIEHITSMFSCVFNELKNTEVIIVQHVIVTVLLCHTRKYLMGEA